MLRGQSFRGYDKKVAAKCSECKFIFFVLGVVRLRILHEQRSKQFCASYFFCHCLNPARAKGASVPCPV